MAIEAGNAIEGTGLAGAIAKARRESWGKDYDVRKDRGVNAEAKAIVDYLVANVEVTVDTETGEGTIQ